MPSSKKEKTFDGAKVLGEVTGLGPKVVNEIWEEAKANIKRLNECKRPHKFVQDEPGRLRSRWTCELCGGKVSANDARWYTQGLKDARL